MTEIKYFKVVAKCGHVGRNNYIPIVFAVMAKTRKEASSLVRLMPRVKHHQKDAILECSEVAYEDFIVIKDSNDKDEYLKCKNIQEQNNIVNLKNRVLNESKIIRSNNHKERCEYLQKKYKLMEMLSFESLKNYIKDFNNEVDEYEYCS